MIFGGEEKFDGKSFLERIVHAIVDHPDDVTITEIDSENTLIYELRVNQSDMGKIIGRKGQNAKAIRTLLNAASAKGKKRAVLEIVE